MNDRFGLSDIMLKKWDVVRASTRSDSEEYARRAAAVDARVEKIENGRRLYS
jgi:hypothetical protein